MSWSDFLHDQKASEVDLMLEQPGDSDFTRSLLFDSRFVAELPVTPSSFLARDDGLVLAQPTRCPSSATPPLSDDPSFAYETREATPLASEDEADRFLDDEPQCWGALLSQSTANCVEGYTRGAKHQKNKFCEACRSRITIPLSRIAAILPEEHDKFLNSWAGGIWARNGWSKVGFQYRVVNHTAQCTGPRLLVFKGEKPPLDWAPVPEELIDRDGAVDVVHFFISKGTLVPKGNAHAGRGGSCSRPPAKRRRTQAPPAAERPPPHSQSGAAFGMLPSWEPPPAAAAHPGGGENPFRPWALQAAPSPALANFFAPSNADQPFGAPMSPADHQAAAFRLLHSHPAATLA